MRKLIELIGKYCLASTTRSCDVRHGMIVAEHRERVAARVATRCNQGRLASNQSRPGGTGIGRIPITHTDHAAIHDCTTDPGNFFPSSHIVSWMRKMSHQDAQIWASLNCLWRNHKRDCESLVHITPHAEAAAFSNSPTWRHHDGAVVALLPRRLPAWESKVAVLELNGPDNLRANLLSHLAEALLSRLDALRILCGAGPMAVPVKRCGVHPDSCRSVLRRLAVYGGCAKIHSRATDKIRIITSF